VPVKTNANRITEMMLLKAVLNAFMLEVRLIGL